MSQGLVLLSPTTAISSSLTANVSAPCDLRLLPFNPTCEAAPEGLKYWPSTSLSPVSRTHLTFKLTITSGAMTSTSNHTVDAFPKLDVHMATIDIFGHFQAVRGFASDPEEAAFYGVQKGDHLADGEGKIYRVLTSPRAACHLADGVEATHPVLIMTDSSDARRSSQEGSLTKYPKGCDVSLLMADGRYIKHGGGYTTSAIDAEHGEGSGPANRGMVGSRLSGLLATLLPSTGSRPARRIRLTLDNVKTTGQCSETDASRATFELEELPGVSDWWTTTEQCGGLVIQGEAPKFLGRQISGRCGYTTRALVPLRGLWTNTSNTAAATSE